MGKFEYVIVGGGIVGLAIAREIRARAPKASICVVDKESDVAMHASGRNSGVVHAGFYYSPDSLKAKLTRDGNFEMRAFCVSNGLLLDRCGKVVVAQNEAELPALETLYERGIANGVDVELISADKLAELEPLASTHKKALWSPNTAVANPIEVSQTLKSQLENDGIVFYWNHKVLAGSNGQLRTNQGQIEFEHLINASGLYSDKIAAMFGFGQKYSMIPFIGLYFYAPKLTGVLRRHIYPTPDPRNPFLGVHYTRTAEGAVKVGPTAIPVVSREQYGLLQGLNLAEMFEIFSQYPKFLFSKHHDTFGLIASELPKLSRGYLLAQARKLAPKIDTSEFKTPGKPGIRAQLFDKTLGKLEMDFVIEGDENSTHVLNAVSPGWTTCFSFARHVVDDMKRRSAI